jgi:hypothetical protein
MWFRRKFNGEEVRPDKLSEVWYQPLHSDLLSHYIPFLQTAPPFTPLFALFRAIAHSYCIAQCSILLLLLPLQIASAFCLIHPKDGGCDVCRIIGTTSVQDIAKTPEAKITL